MDESLHHRPPLTDDHFHVVIIGGGINGVSIARECARAGRRVLIVEQADFASGTTSRATRIIHGGLRYLEHGDLGLVRESLREREHLLQEHNHLVRRMDFILALPRHSGIGRSALAIRTGLWLYRRLAPATHSTHKIEIDKLKSSLDRGLDLQFFSYSDAQCEYPERLTAEWLSEAMTHGAIARNYTKVLAVEIKNGAVAGIRAKDLLTEKEFAVTAEWAINAAGPWVDRVNQHCPAKIGRLIGGVRGSHLIFNRIPAGARALTAKHHALYTEAIDGRPIFAIPWAGQLLFGTTEVTQEPNDDPGNAHASTAEIEYLLASAKRLFGDEHISPADVHYAYSGVRPLPYAPDASMSSVTRNHALHDHAEDGIAQYISVIGGKLTTAGNLGRQCARKIGCDVQEPALAVVAPEAESGIESTPASWAKSIAAMSGLPEEQVRAIAEWHGPRALCVIRAAKHDPRLRMPIIPGSNHLVAEAVDAFHFECAAKLSDILLRRTPIALGASWDEYATQAAAQSIGLALGWDSQRIWRESEDCEAERQSFLKKIEIPAPPVPATEKT